ncbi:hypothetical protein H206_00248 [Candidatus Electrothrix aarhusensis]|uniref:Uncharacterized protein n=1 Tax=Candidatus Electrothrix aarhusensis TaxID=1859131 RepID=A0A3S3QKG3_9BACT|nr:hypothetical protein H206_00248 [Candidatus Electrothrix aarhusensis]
MRRAFSHILFFCYTELDTYLLDGVVMTKEELIQLIDKLENNFVMTAISLAFIHNPDIRHLANQWMDPGSTVKFGSRAIPPEEAKYDVHKMYESFFSDQSNNIDYMIIPMMSMLSLIHDAIRDNGFENHTPEFEFLRHIRNAMSHGNRFTFRNGEPRRTASFEGFTINSSMNGTNNVLHNYIHFGDLLRLINHVKINL